MAATGKETRKENIRRILQLVEDGTLTPEEAQVLLADAAALPLEGESASDTQVAASVTEAKAEAADLSGQAAAGESDIETAADTETDGESAKDTETD